MKVDANCNHLEKGEITLSQHDIEKLIITVRGVQVMIDRDLAMLYGVETKRLNEQVKRNVARFPERYRFQLTREEMTELVVNSRTPISYLNISELPLNRKEIGNTLETRGLTYSYTFLTKPKNAHLGCKGTKQIPSCQMVSYIFFKFIAIFIFIGIQTTLFGHSNEQNPVCHFTYISVPSHCSHL